MKLVFISILISLFSFNDLISQSTYTIKKKWDGSYEVKDKYAASKALIQGAYRSAPKFQSYKIDTVAGVIYFSSDKKIKNINDCYNEQIKIANELHLLFKNAKKKGPIKKKFLAADPTGKSTYNDIYLLLGYQDYFKDRYEVIISCYDWSDHFENREDHMYIGIRSIKISSWLD